MQIPIIGETDLKQRVTQLEQLMKHMAQANMALFHRVKMLEMHVHMNSTEGGVNDADEEIRDGKEL